MFKADPSSLCLSVSLARSVMLRNCLLLGAEVLAVMEGDFDFACLGTTSDNAQGLLLVLLSEFTPGSALVIDL